MTCVASNLRDIWRRDSVYKLSPQTEEGLSTGQGLGASLGFKIAGEKIHGGSKQSKLDSILPLYFLLQFPIAFKFKSSAKSGNYSVSRVHFEFIKRFRRLIFSFEKLLWRSKYLNADLVLRHKRKFFHLLVSLS